MYVIETTEGYAEVNAKTGATRRAIDVYSTAGDHHDYSTLTGQTRDAAPFAVLPNGKLLYVRLGIRLIDPTTGNVERVYHHAACPRDERW